MERRDHIFNNNQNYNAVNGDHGVILNYNPVSNIVHHHAPAPDIDHIELILRPVWSATAEGRGAPSGCLPDTRVQLLREISDWSVAIDGPHIFWLSGVAGTGKTTVVRSAADTIRSGGAGIASFFISRKLSDRRHAVELLFTLAAGIARVHSTANEAILSVLRDCDRHRLPHLALDFLVEKLLLNPIRLIASSESLVRICIIVDALDECEDLDELGGPKFLGALIETISRLNCHRIKVFVSSRPELIIRNCFESAVRETVDLVKEIQLHDVDGNVVQADIRRFFSHHLSSLARRMNMNLPWPSELEFNALVQRTGGLFVYATTVIGFVQDKRFSPAERLRELLETSARHNPHDPSPYAQLDQLYSDLLGRFVGSEDASPDSTLNTRVRAVLAVILYEFEALSLEAVSELTQSTPLELQAIIDGLAALIPIKQDPEPTPSVHASVVDFLADTSRCLDPRFQLSAQNSHNCLAQHCLTVMCERLNGVDLTQSGSDLLATNIWTTVLRYACRHWHSHLILADLTASKDLQDKFAEFCEKYLLTWLRVMCTWGHYPEMRIALQKLAHWYQEKPPGFQAATRVDEAIQLPCQLLAIIARFPAGALSQDPGFATNLIFYLPASFRQLCALYGSGKRPIKPNRTLLYLQSAFSFHHKRTTVVVLLSLILYVAFFIVCLVLSGPIAI